MDEWLDSWMDGMIDGRLLNELEKGKLWVVLSKLHNFTSKVQFFLTLMINTPHSSPKELVRSLTRFMQIVFVMNLMRHGHQEKFSGCC